MDLFTGAAAYYDRFRSPVPEEVVRLLTRDRGQRPRRLLDLGTGTGMVVSALAEEFDDVIAVDPDPVMLEQAKLRRDAEGVTWVCARAEDFAPPVGWVPDLVTICRAFHWMDQEAVIGSVDAYGGAGTAVAVMGDGSVWTSTQPWKAAVRAVVQEFLGEERRAGGGTFAADHHRPFVETLAGSGFPALEEHTVETSQPRDVESVIGYLHSTSFAAEHLFGDRVDDFRARVRQVLASHVADGVVEDRNQFDLILARRATPTTVPPS